MQYKEVYKNKMCKSVNMKTVFEINFDKGSLRKYFKNFECINDFCDY